MFFLILDSITNIYLSFAHFSTTILIDSYLDYIIACFNTLTNSFLVLITACFLPINNLCLNFIHFSTTILDSSYLDFILACFVPLAIVLPIVFLTRSTIIKLIRDTSVTLGGAATVYTARVMAQNAEHDRLRRVAEIKAQASEAARVAAAKACEAKTRALQNQVRELQGEVNKAKNLAKK